MPKKIQTTAKLHSSHILASNAQNTPNEAPTVYEARIPDVQAGLNANICWIIEKAREFQKNIYFYFIGYTKSFDCVNHNKL